MFRLNRNERSHWSGNGVHVEPESVFMISRNMQGSGNGQAKPVDVVNRMSFLIAFLLCSFTLEGVEMLLVMNCQKIPYSLANKP
ncbi:hypothetical protein [Aeromonas sp. ASNIH2]|uniref:hypothetical protein n=1 Tax=Aeromonas sp. ASNIH2 TaxID=1636607 RepID=UPI0018F85307|nr:hypothetical protein [Aeromonas sp. ASNIH2]